jgi:CBS domain-containing protein
MKTKISVRDAMTLHPIKLDVNKGLCDCAKLMARHRIGGVLIVDKKKLVGIVTEQDIVRKLVAKGKEIDIPVKDIMETELVTITSDIDIYEAMMLMRDEDIRHLPVVENEKLVGLITIKDILRIEPQLFDYMVAKYELREADTKPLSDVCQLCGCLTDKLYDAKGTKVCKHCRKLA